jgi:hypothetical protein
LKNNNDALLSATFYVKVLSKIEIQEIGKKLDELKHIKKIADSQTLRYEVIGEGGKIKSNIFEFSKDSISLQFFFKKQGPITYKNNFITFISMLAILKEFYEVRLADLYGYILEALNQNWQNVAHDQTQILESLKERIDVLDESNFSLSKQIIVLSQEKMQLSKNLSLYSGFSKCIIDKTKDSNSTQSESIYTTLIHFGIDSELIKNVERSFS